MRYWMVMVMVAALGGCATELDLTEPEPEPAAQVQTGEFRFIVPHLDQPTVELPDPATSMDPCDCEDIECLEEWAESVLSCDVCVVLLCDDDWHPHVCHLC